jgi:hypothetical protein
MCIITLLKSVVVFAEGSGKLVIDPLAIVMSQLKLVEDELVLTMTRLIVSANIHSKRVGNCYHQILAKSGDGT